MKETQPDIDHLISQTVALTWDDLILELAKEAAAIVTNHAHVGKLVSTKPLNKYTFHAAIKAIQSFITGLTIEDLDQNTFLFTFPTTQDKNKIFSQRPWNFKGYHMILKEWLPRHSLQEVDLRYLAFWIQIHGLPLELVTQENAEKIGRVIGNLLGFDHIVAFVKRFLRIRVEIDTSKPLLDGFILPQLNRQPAKITFKYERLSEFCYICGRLGHVHQSCPHVHGSDVEPQYGQSMSVEGQEKKRTNRVEENLVNTPLSELSNPKRLPSLPPIRINEPMNNINISVKNYPLKQFQNQPLYKGKCKIILEKKGESSGQITKVQQNMLFKGGNSAFLGFSTVLLLPGI
ncbi:uncharacterized protein At4g02000-like [Juglans microcarpa x Juglans regia]|uniref:uncharacterized protein At4g02000-like n=1 Tax=Juglans microcarpa x Juglans regia TaxID=2249226 RepID=UPI001B7DE7D5|nr:uncharacterized protein At4g02000-like [Juglans microcarpa x Juglans regia]